MKIENEIIIILLDDFQLTPFLVSIPISYALKKPEKPNVFWCFQGV